MGVIINSNVQMVMNKSYLNKTKKISNCNSVKSELEKKLDSYKYFSDDNLNKKNTYLKKYKK